MLVDDTFLERNDRVISDRNVLGAYLCAAFCDVAIADPMSVLQFLRSVLGVERVHLKGGRVNEKPWADKLCMFLVISKHVTHILAQETLDTFAKFLHAVDVFLHHSPRTVLGVGLTRLEFLDPLFDLVVPTHVRDQVLYRRKRTHRLDGYRLRKVDRIEPTCTSASACR